FRLDGRGPIVDGRAFEIDEVFQIEAPITGAAGDHYGTRADLFIVSEIQHETSCIRSGAVAQVHHCTWDRHLNPELLRLIICARHQVQAVDPRGETQIVLDPSRRSRLTTEGPVVEHQYRETFGCGVNGSGKTSRTRADDRHVVDSR